RPPLKAAEAMKKRMGKGEEGVGGDGLACWGWGPPPGQRPAQREGSPPAGSSGGTMARASRAGLCPAAAGRRAHESRLGRRPWRLYHASVERRRMAELENY